MKHVVIMAGGSGTRFWPKSTSALAKQFLNLFGKRSMIQMTFDRVKPLVSKKNISVVCSPQFSKMAKKHLPGVSLLLEPEARNTMAAVCLSAWSCYQKDPSAVVCVLPSDAYISNVKEFQKVLENCFEFSLNNNFITCIGIKPTYAATGYGYIQKGTSASNLAENKIFKINRFVEKPNSQTAQEYLSSGDYFWNAGIFVFKASVFINEVRQHAPEFFKAFEEAKSLAQLKKVFKNLPKVAVDVALMEKTLCSAVVPGDFGWNDVGSWPALEEVMRPNSDAGIVLGGADNLSIDSSGIIALADSKKFLALVGVKDLIIVETDKALLICAKDKAQEIKSVVEQLKSSKKTKHQRLV